MTIGRARVARFAGERDSAAVTAQAQSAGGRGGSPPTRPMPGRAVCVKEDAWHSTNLAQGPPQPSDPSSRSCLGCRWVAGGGLLRAVCAVGLVEVNLHRADDGGYVVAIEGGVPGCASRGRRGTSERVRRTNARVSSEPEALCHVGQGALRRTATLVSRVVSRAPSTHQVRSRISV